jgi:hypothetical protein
MTFCHMPNFNGVLFRLSGVRLVHAEVFHGDDRSSAPRCLGSGTAGEHIEKGLMRRVTGIGAAATGSIGLSVLRRNRSEANHGKVC